MQENVRERDPKEDVPKKSGVLIRESNNTSTDDYIATLEAELRSFRASTSKASSSMALLPYDLSERRRVDNDGILVRMATTCT